jgi:DNA-binding GntR family transcriptional regulator
MARLTSLEATPSTTGRAYADPNDASTSLALRPGEAVMTRRSSASTTPVREVLHRGGLAHAVVPSRDRGATGHTSPHPGLPETFRSRDIREPVAAKQAIPVLSVSDLAILGCTIHVAPSTIARQGWFEPIRKSRCFRGTFIPRS